MKTKPLFIAWQIFLLVAVSLLTACSSSKEDSVDTIDIPVDKVKNPTKVSSYEGSATFKNDLDALVTYMLDQRAFRWAYLLMASNGNSETAPFSATLEDIDGEVGKISSEYLYGIIDHFIETSEAYEGAIERLYDYGIIDKVTDSKTRGTKSDVFDFTLGCKKTRVMGRQSVMAILRKGRWTTDTDKLNELYKKLPSSLTRGYSNATNFWSDFSAGKLDNRSNQVFANLYKFDPMEFGATADDLGVTPARNIAIMSGDLMTKGVNVILDASPLATALGYGKDIYNSLSATSDLITKGDVKGFIQTMTNNLTSYGNDMIKIVNKMKKNDVIYWEAAEGFWSEYGQDIANIFINDVAFSDEAKEAMDKGKGAHLIPNIVMTKDANGQEIALVLIYDEKTGQLTAGYVFDKDGNIIADPKLPGMKKITVVDRNGRRVTKTVTVSGDEPNPVIVDMEEGNVVLEDEPANGYLMLQPDKIYDEYGLSGTHEIRVRTNYLYYSSSTEEKWIATSTKTDISLVTIKLAANDTGEKRTGKVFVYGTNKDGKVLKKEVINVIQEPKPAKGDIVWTEPAAVAFDADGGKQNIVVGHFPGYSFIGCMEGSDLAGWCYLETAYSPAGEPTYTIKADPNTTGEERSGTVTFYASNSNSALENVLYNNAKPDGETVAETTVIIKQQAGPLFNARTDVLECRFEVDDFCGLNAEGKEVHSLTWGGYKILDFGSFESDYFSGKFGKFSVSPIGDKGSFTCTGEREESSPRFVMKETLTFTIDQQKEGNYGVAKDLIFTHSHTRSYAEDDPPFSNTTHTWNYTIHLENIPIGYVSKDNTSACWSGGYEKRVKVKKFETTYVIHDDKNDKTLLDFSSKEYIDDDLTRFYLHVFFKQ